MLSSRRFRGSVVGAVCSSAVFEASTYPSWRNQGAMRKHHAVILVAVALFAAAPALAAGFSFYEQSAKASGQAGAWVARADDAAANWYNPAALIHLSGREVQFGTNWVDIGSDTTFTTVSGTKLDAVANSEFPSNFYFSQKINDRVAWGIGLNNPFGLTSEWQDQPLTFSNKRSELATYNLNPNIAFKISDKWSFGAGVDYISAEVKEFSHDVYPTGAANANLKGEGTGFGYNAALQFKTKHLSIAAQYRSATSPVVRGNLTVTSPLGTAQQSASAKVDLPSWTMVGVAWTSDRVDVEVDATYMAWNSFKQLQIDTANPANSTTLIENWAAVWSYRLGVAVRLDKELHHELRFGGVLDDSPISVTYLRPSIPDADRTGYTLGYGWQGKKFGVDVYAMQLDFDNITAAGNPPSFPNGLNADGVVNGTYESSILLVGGTFKYRF